jgi:hypothetical protein
MDFCKSYKQRLINFSYGEFDEMALDLFRHQALYNQVYRQYIEARNIAISEVETVEQIPFLPISFFKSHQIKTGSWEDQHVFESSGTTGMTTSKHHVKDLVGYQQNALRLFEDVYGSISEYHFLALLPSYLERDSSSLVYMVDYFVKIGGSEYSGFYLDEVDQLIETLELLKEDRAKKTVLIGVTFALLDLVAQHSPSLPDLIVMETGGMKGRRKEMIRAEVHALLQSGFQTEHIHSEYGMTELFSQAYALSGGIFQEPKTMKVLIRDINDPLTLLAGQVTGGMNVIDLANVDSCAFIETQDMGRRLSESTFEVLGRFDNSDVRGCSMLAV